MDEGALGGELRDHLRRGELMDLAHGADIDERAMLDWDARHDVDSAVLRALLLSPPDVKHDPRGLQLRGARIRGRLDLDFIEGPRILMEGCCFEDGLSVRN